MPDIDEGQLSKVEDGGWKGVSGGARGKERGEGR